MIWHSPLAIVFGLAVPATYLLILLGEWFATEVEDESSDAPRTWVDALWMRFLLCAITAGTIAYQWSFANQRLPHTHPDKDEWRARIREYSIALGDSHPIALVTTLLFLGLLIAMIRKRRQHTAMVDGAAFGFCAYWSWTTFMYQALGFT